MTDVDNSYNARRKRGEITGWEHAGCHETPMARYAEDDHWGAPPDFDMTDAACKRWPEINFFERTDLPKAKSVCYSCPLMDECRQYALKHGWLKGVWGGMSEDDRNKIHWPSWEKIRGPHVDAHVKWGINDPHRGGGRVTVHGLASLKDGSRLCVILHSGDMGDPLVRIKALKRLLEQAEGITRVEQMIMGEIAYWRERDEERYPIWRAANRGA